MTELKPLIVILGPTASGKTGLALELAKKWDGELINADSRQIYREMDIATNKTLGAAMAKTEVNNEIVYLIDGIPLYLLDIINPDQSFSLADYKDIAQSKIETIQQNNKLPILVGGTGLYISAIVDNLTIPKVAPDENMRGELEARNAKELFTELKSIDPASADSIGPDNKRKLIRALEVCKTTGERFSSLQEKGKPLFKILQIGVKTERKELYDKVDRRVDKMIAVGLVEETERLMSRYSPDLPAMSGIGYKEIGAYLRKEITLDEAIQLIKFRTHQYVRRQTTWFKRDERIRWVENYEEAKKLVEDFLK